MKTSRYTEPQIIVILRQAEGGVPVSTPLLTARKKEFEPRQTDSRPMLMNPFKPNYLGLPPSQAFSILREKTSFSF